LSTDIVAPPV
nr:RecName: Full=Snake venom metalloproteinase patagonfibrase; Short=SVMP [Philodryas patagoniensis]